MILIEQHLRAPEDSSKTELAGCVRSGLLSEEMKH